MTTPTPSKTPRADAGIRVSVYGDVRCDMEVARLLELELNAERATSATLVRDLAAAQEARQAAEEKGGEYAVLYADMIASRNDWMERAQAAEKLAADARPLIEAAHAECKANREIAERAEAIAEQNAKDAERLEWLISRCTEADIVAGLGWLAFGHGSIRAGIDAAIAEGPKHG